MLVVTQTNPGTIWEETTSGYEFGEVGIIGDHLWRLAATSKE